MTKEIKCDCGWSVRADTDDDLVAEAQEHAREAHHMDSTREQLLSMARPV
jgi:predicted small metal-binding protein